MGDPVRLVLLAEQAMGEEGALVLELLVGDDDQGSAWFRWAIARELVQKLRKGALECLRLKTDAPVEVLTFGLLLVGHPARAAQSGVRVGEDEAGARGDGESDVVGEELGPVEADESVGAD